jgi:ribosomal protein S18 acetylase RimI-like enzyme
MPPAEIRKATLADQQAIIRILTRAFDGDPVVNWLMREDHKRRAAFAEFFEVCFRKLAYPHGEVVVATDLHAAALWVPPGKWKVGFLTQLVMAPRYMRCARGKIIRSFRALNNTTKAHPHEPHYYLLQIGTDPEHQGKGHARRLIEPVLRRCDEEQVGAYLEPSSEKNLSYYQRYGFEVTGEIDMGKGGPPCWSMWRKPV